MINIILDNLETITRKCLDMNDGASIYKTMISNLAHNNRIGGIDIKRINV